jgi:hypothetical protein
MIHVEAPRIEATSAEERALVFCSEICRDEFAELFDLVSPGNWTTRATPRPRRVVST